jgi:hypothetical protein
VWEDDIEMDLGLVGHGDVEWDQQWRCLENTVGSRRFPLRKGMSNI